ncbi:MAG TPA: Lrp/AsnC ligand binding domain-containing protein [Dehalococcoidia bacterium]|nr:Lrp/AsnC ligand binding domain-containing protein [Dehalococcoidia bacterium]
MIKAYVLIVADPARTRTVADLIRQIPGVVECHQVMGPYDIVAELEVENLTDIPPILGERIRKIEGIHSTTSLVTLPEG